MSRKSVHRLPPPPGKRLELQDFAQRLAAEMNKRGWTKADLARRAFGETLDERGFKVAKSRDRVSFYVRGLQKPGPKNLGLIAKALGMSAAELAPDIDSDARDREPPEVMLNVVPGHSDKAHLVVNTLVPLSVGAKIIGMLSDLKKDE